MSAIGLVWWSACVTHSSRCVSSDLTGEPALLGAESIRLLLGPAEVRAVVSVSSQHLHQAAARLQELGLDFSFLDGSGCSIHLRPQTHTD